MKKTIGIIGGMGPLATCELMRRIIELSPVDKDQDHARILMDCNSNIPDRTDAILHGGESPVSVIVEMGKRLEEAGADLLLIPCNTTFYFYDEIFPHFQAPLLHMPRITARELKKRGVKKAGILATNGTIATGLYPKILEEVGIEAVQPQGEQQDIVHSVIYDGIKAGRGSIDTDPINRVMDALEAQGAECLVLGCTELPLAFRTYHLNRNTIDPESELAKEAIRFALGKEPKKY